MKKIEYFFSARGAESKHLKNEFANILLGIVAAQPMISAHGDTLSMNVKYEEKFFHSSFFVTVEGADFLVAPIEQKLKELCRE